MKKTLYTTIILGVAALSLGTQVMNTTTALASDEIEQTGSNEETTSSVDESVGGYESIGDIISNDSEFKMSENGVGTDTVKYVTDQGTQTGADTETSEEIKTVPVTEENNGTWDKDIQNDYVKTIEYDGETNVRSGHLTDMVYSRGGDLSKLPQTPKVLKLIAILDQAKAFLDDKYSQNYKDIDELNAYFAKFDQEYATVESYADNGEPVVIPTKHVTKHTSNNNLKSFITKKQTTLYTAAGKVVKHRSLANNTVWSVMEVTTINGQKMYRVSTSEWVFASDVQ